MLGLYLTWSKSVAYGYYEHVPRIWGLSPIEDQNVGGAIMMLEQSLVLVTAFCILFVRMLIQSEEEERRRERLEDAATTA
jgi:cytochrome c oxidase assembly factor CtaG